jgi:Penicillin binding protein transpeptidase domain/NTF2-like N-terminal transpeptidase domain
MLAITVAGVLAVRSSLAARSPASAGSTAADDQPVPGAATAVAARFLADWAAGRVTAAAQRTDNPEGAAAGLREWRHGLRASGVGIRPGTAAAGSAEVPFTVALTAGSAGHWQYESSLSLVQATEGWLVSWSPAVLHPRLTDSTMLQLGSVRAQGTGIADRHGRALTGRRYPSLAGIATKLTGLYPRSTGRPGTAVQLVDRFGGAVTETLATLVPPGAASGLRTTFDADVQAAAERATGTRPESALVVLEPSTGGILAIANSPAGGIDRALLARLAPGSTMKVITTAALLATGLSPTATAPCSDSVTVNGKTFHNAEGVVNGNLSLTADFARSCNTAFIGLRDRLADGALTGQATAVFGLTAWDIGLGEPVTYGDVPPPGDSVTKAADMIGQGTVAMSPLAMASVAATVATGRFTQPALVTAAARTRADRPLPAGTASALRAMMRQVVTAGTARRALGDLPGSVHAKTGTAEAPGGDNGWLIGYRGDLAFGCLVEGGGHGADSCGPLVRDFLRSVAG